MSSSDENQTWLTDIEFVAAIRDHLDERMSAGVRIAVAVSEIGCIDGAVTVVFDPQETRISVQLFPEVKGFENLARFIGTPFAFDDDDGQWFRNDWFESRRTSRTDLHSGHFLLSNSMRWPRTNTSGKRDRRTEARNFLAVIPWAGNQPLKLRPIAYVERRQGEPGLR